jgi:TetR/AcrR family transcriptional regulator, tetracycline repressor protein
MARQTLSRERVVRAALDLIDRDGLDALSMRKLGAALGVEAMALYRHVGSKERLLEGVVEALLEELELPAEGAERAGSWQDAWLALARSYRRLARSHPGAFRLLALSPLSTAARFERAQAPVAILRDAGFDEELAQLAFRTLLSYADGHLLRELAEGEAELSPAQAEAAFDFGIRAILTGLRPEAAAA